MKDSKDKETIDMFQIGNFVTANFVTNITLPPIKSKRGRKPLGYRAMTGAERIAKFRARAKNNL